MTTVRRIPIRGKQGGRWPLRLFLGIALALAVLLVCGLGVLKMHDWRVERAMARFRAAPSAQHAARLTELLAEGSVTRAQGARILTLLLRPTIVTRPAYPVGQSVGISVERPFPISIAGSRIEFLEDVWAGERPLGRRGQSTGTLDNLPEVFLARSLPSEPGVYHGEIHATCKILDTAIRIRKLTLWDRFDMKLRTRLGRPPVVRAPVSTEPTYQCRFTVPFDLNMVEKDRAERLALIADPQTDGTVRAAIATRTSEQHGVYETATGRRGHRGSTYVTCETLRVAVAFELSLRLADGRELPAGANSQRQHLRVRAGTSGIFLVNVGSFGLTEPGEYSGTLVLRSDPEYAYEDPAIKSIWNDTLEFPVSFVVYVRTQIE